MGPQQISTWLSVAAAVTLAAPGLASAQALQVFAIGDAGVAAQSGLPSAEGNGNPSTSVSTQSGAWQASRVGFRGRLKLTDDFDAWYDAATTVNLVRGTVGNSTSGTFYEWFDRNAFVGVASKNYGNLTFGRHPSMVTEALWVTDPLKANNGAQNPNVRFGYLVAPGQQVLQNFGTNTTQNCVGCSTNLDRQSQSVRYVYGNSGFLGMVMYGFGGANGDRSRNQYVGLNLGYDSDESASHGPQDRPLEGKPFAYSIRLAGAMYNDTGTVAGTAANPNVVSLYQWTGGGVVRWNDWKLKATYTGHKIDNDSAYGGLETHIGAGGITYTARKDLDLTAAVYHVYRKVVAAPCQDATKIYFVPEWYITKSFWVYGIFDYEIYNGTAAFVPANTPLSNYGSIASSSLAPGQHNSFYMALGLSWAFST